MCMVDQWDPRVCACWSSEADAAWAASHWRCISCGVALLSGIIMSFVCRFIFLFLVGPVVNLFWVRVYPSVLSLDAVSASIVVAVSVVCVMIVLT